MYTKHFGLNILPFENVPDPIFFFNEGEHARVLSRITDSIHNDCGLTVLTGPDGSGKSTLSQMIMSGFSDIHVIWMPEPPDTSLDLFLFIEDDICQKRVSSEKAFILKAFILKDIKVALLQIRSRGGKCLLIIDESHQISEDALNGIWRLNNLKSKQTNILQVLLLGQQDFLETLNKPGMAPFKRAISTLACLEKMSISHVRQYISHRIEKAGGHSSLFADSAWDALMKAFASGGIPRIINSLCDRSLHEAFKRNNNIVESADVYSASQELGLTEELIIENIQYSNIDHEEDVPVENMIAGTVPDISISTDSVEDEIDGNHLEPETSQQEQILPVESMITESVPDISISTDSVKDEIDSNHREPETSQPEQILPVESMITESKPDISISTDSVEDEIDGNHREPETSKPEQKPRNKRFFINSIKHHCWSFVHNILNDPDVPDKNGKDPIQVKEYNDTADIVINTDPTPSKLNTVPTNDNLTKYIMDDSPATSTHEVSSLEWITIDSKGERPFKIESAVDRKKPADVNIDEWVTIDSNSERSYIPACINKKPLSTNNKPKGDNNRHPFK